MEENVAKWRIAHRTIVGCVTDDLFALVVCRVLLTWLARLVPPSVQGHCRTGRCLEQTIVSSHTHKNTFDRNFKTFFTLVHSFISSYDQLDVPFKTAMNLYEQLKDI